MASVVGSPWTPAGSLPALEATLQAVMTAVERVQAQYVHDSQELRKNAESMACALQSKMAEDKDFSVHTRDIVYSEQKRMKAIEARIDAMQNQLVATSATAMASSMSKVQWLVLPILLQVLPHLFPPNGSGDGDYDGGGMVATDAQSILQIVRRTAAHHNDTIFQIANEGLQQRLREPHEAEPATTQVTTSLFPPMPELASAQNTPGESGLGTWTRSRRKSSWSARGPSCHKHGCRGLEAWKKERLLLVVVQL